MSSFGWSCYRCLVWKIIISLKNSFTTVCSWKNELLLPADIDQKQGRPLAGGIDCFQPGPAPEGARTTPTDLISIEVAWVVPAWPWSERFGSIVWTSTQNWVRLCSCRLCSSICCSATPHKVWHLKMASHPVKCFWCNYEKEYIYSSWRDAVRNSRKFDKRRANQFLPLLQIRLC